MRWVLPRLTAMSINSPCLEKPCPLDHTCPNQVCLNAEKRDNLLFLKDILLAIKRAQEYIGCLDQACFESDYKTVDLVGRNFEVTGEASKNVSSSIKRANPPIPWMEMYRLRNRISHGYVGWIMKSCGISPIATSEKPCRSQEDLWAGAFKKRNVTRLCTTSSAT